MKKQLLKTKILSFGVLTFLLSAFNVGQAQNLWTGATDNLFVNPTNWTTAPLFDGTDNLRIVSTTNNPILLNNSASATPLISVVQFQTSVSTELTIASDLTSTGTANTQYVYIAGKLHITGGTFWGKSNMYFGNSTGELPYCNIETGGTLKVKASILVGRNSPCTIDVNGGTITGESSGAIAIGNYFAAGPGIVNLNTGNIKINKIAGFGVGPYGTANINGGKLEFPVGDLSVKGTLNINAGIVNFLGTTASTINTAATAGTINLNGGKITVGGTLSTINTVINVDAGTLVLAGDQTATMAGFITSNTIKLSTAAATAGKVLSNTYDSVTNLTTVMASPALGVEEFVADDFSIFPNPSVDGKFSITFPNGFEGAKVSIRTVLGQEIYKITVGTATTVDVNPGKELASGIYFLQIEKDGKSVTKKLVVK